MLDTNYRAVQPGPALWVTEARVKTSKTFFIFKISATPLKQCLRAMEEDQNGYILTFKLSQYVKIILIVLILVRIG